MKLLSEKAIARLHSIFPVDYFYFLNRLPFKFLDFLPFQIVNLKKQADSKKLWAVVLFFFVVIVALISEALYLHYANQVHNNKKSPQRFQLLFCVKQGEVHVLGHLYLEKDVRRVRVYPGDPESEVNGSLPPVLETLVGVGWPEGPPARKKKPIKALPCFNPDNRHVTKPYICHVCLRTC